ncbi:MAG: hypothetical protein WC503_02970 [Candidatus Shapirobacteria bacterium]
MKLKEYLKESDEQWSSIKNEELKYSFYLSLDGESARFSFSQSPDFVVKNNARELQRSLIRGKDSIWDKFYELEKEDDKNRVLRRRKLVEEVKHILDTSLGLIKAKLQKAALEDEKLMKKNAELAAKA